MNGPWRFTLGMIRRGAVRCDRRSRRRSLLILRRLVVAPIGKGRSPSTRPASRAWSRLAGRPGVRRRGRQMLEAKSYRRRAGGADRRRARCAMLASESHDAAARELRGEVSPQRTAMRGRAAGRRGRTAQLADFIGSDDGRAEENLYEVEELLMQPGTYFNPQTEVLVVVDDSTSLDQEVFNMEAYEGAEWVRISDEVPVDEDRRDRAARELPDPLPPRLDRLGLRDRARTGRRGARRGRGRPGPGPRGLMLGRGGHGAGLHAARPGRQRGHARRA